MMLPAGQTERRKAPSSLTDEQVEWFAAENKRTVRTVTKRAFTGYLMLLLGIAAAFLANSDTRGDSFRSTVHSGRVVAVEGCNRDYRSMEAIRGVLVASKRSVKQQLRRGLISEERAATADAFYAEQLAKLILPDCRTASKLLTSDPEILKVKIPHPLHPKKG